jgi:hypothetical protein
MLVVWPLTVTVTTCWPRPAAPVYCEGARGRPWRQASVEVGLEAARRCGASKSRCRTGLFAKEFLIAGYQHRHGCHSQVLGLLGPGDAFVYFHAFSVYFGVS